MSAKKHASNAFWTLWIVLGILAITVPETVAIVRWLVA